LLSPPPRVLLLFGNAAAAAAACWATSGIVNLPMLSSAFQRSGGPTHQHTHRHISTTHERKTHVCDKKKQTWDRANIVRGQYNRDAKQQFWQHTHTRTNTHTQQSKHTYTTQHLFKHAQQRPHTYAGERMPKLVCACVQARKQAIPTQHSSHESARLSGCLNGFGEGDFAT
jgi:hypothetical protein